MENDKNIFQSYSYGRPVMYTVMAVSTIVFIAIWLAPSEYTQNVVKDFAAWHTLMECFSVAVSATIFSIIWQSHVSEEAKYRLSILSIAFLAIAILDAAHMLSFDGMPPWITPSGQGKGVPLWFFARYAAAVAMFILILPPLKKFSFKLDIPLVALIAAIYVFIPLYLVFSKPDLHSLFIVPGEGLTPLKIALEWGLIAILSIVFVVNLYTRRTATFYMPDAITLAIYMTILSELCFTLYSNVASEFSLLGHIYKIIAYYFLYQGIVVTSFKLPYRMLAQNQELLQQITSNIKQIFLLSSKDRSEVYYVSSAFEEMTGRSDYELKQHPAIWYQVIHPDDRDKVKAIIQNLSGNPVEHEFRIQGADGQTYIMQENIYPVLDSNGEIQRVASVCEDITRKEQLQQALKERDRTISNLINTIPSLISSWDANLLNRFANRPYANWHGKTPEEIKGLHFKELMGDKIYQHAMPYLEKVLKGEPQQFEMTATTIDGVEQNLLVNYVPDTIDEEIVGFFAAISDISSVKKAHEDLSTSKDRLMRSQSMGHIGSWEIDVTTGQAWWSDENYRIYGITKDSRVDMHTAFDMAHPDERESLLKIWQNALESRGTFSQEHRIVTASNEVKYVWEFAEITLDSDNKPKVIAGCTQDITERKQTEHEQEILQHQLVQSQKMESIGHLTGGIAHDFNNMLGAMLGYTELLKQLMASSNRSDQRTDKYISEILTAGNRAKELISQMLVFSRFNPESEHDTPTILVQPVIKEVVNLLRSSIPTTININYMSTDDSLMVMMHPIQLHQILLNLAINARDAISEYGEIVISVDKTTTKGKCKSCFQDFAGDFVEIKVHDDGEGMEPEIVSKVFDPFYSTKEVGKGTGMGLSVVHGAVHAVGGHIELESQLGKGTTVKVLLPLGIKSITSKEKSRNLRAVDNKKAVLSGLRIMVVDDEFSITSMLSDLLQLYGAQVTTFNKSSKALSVFMKNINAYDLVITDETMPDLSGLDMSRTMLKKRKRLPIILCTGFSDHVSQQVAEENGLSGFMLKPVNIQELIEMIADIKDRIGK